MTVIFHMIDIFVLTKAPPARYNCKDSGGRKQNISGSTLLTLLQTGGRKQNVRLKNKNPGRNP